MTFFQILRFEGAKQKQTFIDLEFLYHFSLKMSGTGLRQRKKTFGRTVEDLDAFPKVAEPYVEQEASSAIGKKHYKINEFITILNFLSSVHHHNGFGIYIDIQ